MLACIVTLNYVSLDETTVKHF